MGGFTGMDLADKVGLLFFVLGLGALGLAVGTGLLRASRRRRALREGWLDPIQLQEILLGTAPLLVDLRDAQGFHGARGHIRGSLNVPFPELAARMKELETQDARPVVFVAEHEEHVREAMALARGAGHTWIYGLQGGIAAWKRASRPLVTPKAAS